MDFNFSFINYTNLNSRQKLETLHYHSWYDFSNMPDISDNFETILDEVLNLLPNDMVFIDNQSPLAEIIKRKSDIEFIPLDKHISSLDEERYFIFKAGAINNAREISTAINVLTKTPKFVAFCGTFPVIKDSESFFNSSTNAFNVYGEPHYYLQDTGGTMSQMLLELDYRGRVLPNISLLFLRAFLKQLKGIDYRCLRANQIATIDEIALAYMLEPTIVHKETKISEDVQSENFINRNFNICMTTKLMRLLDDL